MLSARYTFRLRANDHREEGGGDAGGRVEERRLLKVGGKFGSAAKLTQLSSPLLKRNFAVLLSTAPLLHLAHLSSLPPFSISNDERFLLDIPAVCPEK